MLAVLFPHLFEDTEYLIPQADGDPTYSFTNDGPVYEDSMVLYNGFNDLAPVAGPSGL